MKKFFTLMLTYALFASSTVFANTSSNVNMLIKDYHVDIRVNNLDAQTAIDNFTKNIIDNDISKSELLSYIKENSTSAEYQNFSSMLEMSAQDLQGVTDINSPEFSYIMAEVFSTGNQEVGANYAGSGCSGGLTIGFGVAAIVVAVIMARQIYRSQNDQSTNDNVFSRQTLRNRQIITGVTGALGLLLIVNGSRC